MKNRFEDPAELTVRRTAGAVAVFAFLVLVGGWLFDVATLRTIAPMWSAMAPLTALLLILASCALLWFERRRGWANGVLLISLLAAAAILVEYLFDVPLGLQASMRMFDRLNGAPLPELPAPDTAMAVVLLVLALACWQTANGYLHDFADVVAVVIGVICLQVLLSYAYHVTASASWSGFRQIAPHTTLSMMVLAFAATARRPTPGVFAALTGNAQSSRQLRRLLPMTLLLCVLMGLLHVLAVRAHAGTIPDLAAWTVTGTMVLLALLLFVTSADMRKAEATVQRRQEELIAAKGAAEAASEAKSRFMSVMSHELRTPLTAMIGYADLLDGGAAGEPTAEARAYLQRIRASGWHLVGLIDAVLLYASGRIPADKVERKRVDVSELVTSTTEVFEMQARDKSLILRVDSPGAVWVSTDARKLRQILSNLLSNAVKFTAKGAITVRVLPEQEKVRIEVIDTGIGIDAEHLAHIWEPFQLVDASHTRAQGGTGLGLALTRQLVEQLGVELGVHSQVGAGSTFTIELPRTDAHDAPGVRLDDTRVLVVDDEQAVLRIMARTLARYGAQVTQAESAQEALAHVDEQGMFDVVVTDVSMPGMTGIELAHQLHSRHVAAPVLFVTGAELDAKDYTRIARLGGQLLKKPFDMAELARAVAGLTETR